MEISATEVCTRRKTEVITSLLLTVFMSLTLFSTVFADQATESSMWAISPEPSWGSQAEPGSQPAKNARGGKFYDLVERQHRYTDKAESYTSYIRYIYTITSTSGLDSSAQISIDFDPSYESVNLHKVVLRRNDTENNQLLADNIRLLQQEKELDEGLYNGKQTLHMLLPDHRVGDQLEVSYSIIGNNPVFENKIFGWSSLEASVPVGTYFFRLRYPEDKTVNTRLYSGDVAATEQNTVGHKEITWINNNPAGYEYQSNTPHSFDIQTQLQYSEFTQWSDVSNWATPLYKPEEHTPPSIKNYAAKLKSESDNLDDQIAAAVTFVQDEIRYTGINSGIGGFMPDSTADIFQRRFGDCKDKAVLLVSILKELGVTAYPTLVHSRNGKAIPGYLPSPDVFNHMIVHIPDYNGNSYWIDGTISLQGSTLEHLVQGAYHSALVPALGDNGLINYEISANELPEKEVVERYTLKYNTDPQPSTLQVTSIFRGSEAEYLRHNIHYNSADDLQNNYLKFYQNRFYDVTIAEDMKITDDRDNNTITVVEKYSIAEALEFDEDNSDELNDSFLLTVHADTMAHDLAMPSDKRRHQPLAQRYPVNVSHTIQLVSANGWNIPAESSRIQNSSFSYHASNTLTDPQTLTLSYTLKTLKDTVEVSESRRYMKDLKKMLNDPYYQVVFTVPVVQTSSLDRQLDSIGVWFKKNMELMGQSSVD